MSSRLFSEDSERTATSRYTLELEVELEQRIELELSLSIDIDSEYKLSTVSDSSLQDFSPRILHRLSIAAGSPDSDVFSRLLTLEISMTSLVLGHWLIDPSPLQPCWGCGKQKFHFIIALLKVFIQNA